MPTLCGMRAADSKTPISEQEKALLISMAIIAAWIFAKPFFTADPSYWYFDDFYYYLIPAKQFLATGHFEFYPGIPTNGFQPLWMAVIVSILVVSPQHDVLFFALFNVVLWFLFILGVYQACALAREQKAAPVFRIAAGVFTAALQIEISTTGMESAICIPLLFWFTRLLLRRPLSQQSPRHALFLGLIASLVILARLDAAMLCAPMALLFFYREFPAKKQIAALAAGALPLWAYLLANLLFTHSLMPISGQAKMLKPLSFSIRPMTALFDAQGFDAFMFFSLIAALVCASAFTKTPERLKHLWLAALLGTALYYGSYCLLTDWQLWFWYMYPLAWTGVLSIIRLSAIAHRFVAFGLITVMIVACLPPLIMTQLRSPQGNLIYQRSLDIAAFAKQHPGHYAMGDCAGTASHLMHRPVLQTEGLVGDQEFLAQIRAQEPLSEMLKRYHIDYYVATHAQEHDGCFHVREPYMAGPASAVMTGATCAKPLYYGNKGDSVAIFRAQDITK